MGLSLMAQLGFGLDTNTTVQETGYDQYKKRDDFEFTPITVLIGLVIVLAIIFFKKTQSNSDNTNSIEDNNYSLENINVDSLLSSRKKELVDGAIKTINFTRYALKNLNIALNVTNETQLKNDMSMIQTENKKMMKFIKGEIQKDIFQGKSIDEVEDIDATLDVLFERIIKFDSITRSAYIKHFNGDVDSYDEKFS